MPKRRHPVFDELFAKEKERTLDLLARARAAQEGRPAFSRKPSPALEAEAWDGVDRNVTDEQYAQIAQATIEELSQERDEQGMPLWTLEQIDLEVRYRQSVALHPYREMTFTSGLPDDDYEARAAEAEKVARRAERRNPQPVVDENGWELVDEDAPLPMPGQGAVRQTAQPMTAPAPQQMAAPPEPMEGVAY